MDQHDRALALEQVAQRLLAVQCLLADQVEHIVLDLEGDADQSEGLVEAVEQRGPRDACRRPRRAGTGEMQVYQPVFFVLMWM